MKHINKFFLIFILIFIFAGVLKPYTVSAKEIDNEGLTAYLNKVTKEKFEKYKLPSLCMVVVKDGKVIYQDALGYEDIENKRKADVNVTSYRIGSTSKLFTETAIMQLYEQGKINLKEDANTYLKDVKIQNRFSKKVTVENLLTHTSGIDEATFSYSAAKTEKDLLPLSEFLKKHPPVVTTEPGKICLYSNIGIDLLGRIIENVSGMKYEDYIQKNIFNTLDMKNSKVSLPLKNTAKNYDSLVPANYYYYNDSPAGGINSTPADIAKFMIAHLENGAYKGGRILSQNTTKLMHETYFFNDKNLLGVSYGFWEKNINGKRIIGHEGALSIGYFGDMLLCPEDNLGIYIVSNNLTEAAPAIIDIENSFFDKYYPKNINKAYSNTMMDEKDASKYIGSYRSYHDSSKENYLKLGAIYGDEDVRIDYDKSKKVLVYHGTSHLRQKEDVNLIKVSDNLFRRADNNDLVAFREEKGNVKYVFFNSEPYNSFERVELKDNSILNLGILLVAVIVFMFQILKSIVILIKNLFKKKTKSDIKSKELAKLNLSRIFKLTVLGISLLNIMALLGIMYWSLSMDIYYSTTWYAKLSSMILVVTPILTIVSTIVFLLSIVKEKTRFSYKLLSIGSLLIMYSFIFFICNWNLIGFKY